MSLRLNKLFCLCFALMTLTFLFSGCAKNAVVAEAVPPIRILTTTAEYDPVRYQTAIEIANWWTELGLTIEIESLEFGDLMYRVRELPLEEKDWDAYMLIWSGRIERADPDLFIYSLSHSSQSNGGNNMGGYNNPVYDDLAEAQRRISDPELRRLVVHAAQEELSKDIPYITLFYRYIHSAYRMDLWHNLPSIPGEGMFHEWLPYHALATDKNSTDYLIVAGNQPPTSLNPLEATTVWEWKILRLFYDKLARVNQSFRPEPWAAKEIFFESDTTVKVVLRDGMTFHDGTPLTVQDVKFSFDFMTVQNVPYFRAFLSPIKNTEIIDDQTLIFTLHEPYAPFITMTLAQIPLLPKHLWENWDPLEHTAFPTIGSGPMVLEHSENDANVSLKKFDAHFSSNEINIPGLKYTVYENTEAIVRALITGEAHVSGAYLDPDWIPALIKEDQINLLQSPDLGFYILGLNLYKGPFSDPNLRKAVMKSTDLNYLVMEVLNGYGDIGGAAQPISTGNPFWKNNNVTTYPFDISSAKRLLIEAGYQWDNNGKLLYPIKTP